MKKSFSPLNYRINLVVVTIVVIIVFAVSFVAGTRYETIAAWLRGVQNTSLNQNLDFSSVQEVYDKLRNNYDGKLDANKLIDGAKKGLTDAAADPYTVYFTAEDAKQFADGLDGRFSGIGAELGKKDGNIVIVSTLDGTPAQKSGLLSNDAIVKVNDQETTNWSIDKAVSQIRGEKGTTVKLAIVRGQELKEFSIIRDNIINPSVKSEITEDNIGVLRISRFAENDTVQLAQKAAADFKSHNVKGVVLDLRGNGGGYLTAAQQISSLWLAPGQVVVQERTGNVVNDTLKAQGNPTLAGIPTVILIDGGSASASEIVAGALHDHKIAKLVGEKSFGKGSVQQILDLPSGGQLKVTVAKWYTPNGKNIHKEGISPDVAVKPTEADIAATKDPAKDKAFELLNK
jgi:carboxyl-terminal processing protease